MDKDWLEGHREEGKQRGIDSGHEVLQECADTFEPKMSECGENGTYWRWWTLAILVGGIPRGTEFNGEIFEVGHHSQTSEDCLGSEGSRRRNALEDEVDEVGCGQKKFWKCREWNPIEPEILELGCRSTQEPIGKSWNVGNAALAANHKTNQRRKWHVHPRR